MLLPFFSSTSVETKKKIAEKTKITQNRKGDSPDVDFHVPVLLSPAVHYGRRRAPPLQPDAYHNSDISQVGRQKSRSDISSQERHICDTTRYFYHH